MTCKNCGNDSTIKAHLIPKSFALEVAPASGVGHALVRNNGRDFTKSQTGGYDQNILCAQCDAILGENEQYVFEALKKIREVRADPGKCIVSASTDTHKIIRFACGVLWKYSQTTRDLGRINVGSYTDILAGVAFGLTKVPPEIDMFVLRLWTASGDTGFYRAPLAVRFSGGLNGHRFLVGSHLFNVKMDRRESFSFPGENVWMRQADEWVVPVIPAVQTEDWRDLMASKDDDRINRFLEAGERLAKREARTPLIFHQTTGRH